MRNVLSIVLPLLLTTALSAATPSLSDAEAKRVIENYWSGLPAKVKLGNLAFYDDPGRYTDYTQNHLSIDAYPMYQALAQLGVIEMRDDPEWSNYVAGGKSSHGWTLFAEQSKGLRKKVTVASTPKGLQIARAGGLPQPDGWLHIKQATYKIDRIVKNEPQERGTNTYRIVMATYTATWTLEFKQAMDISGRKLLNDRKAVVLLKFDPFESRWIPVAQDLANRNEEFATSNVTKALSH